MAKQKKHLLEFENELEFELIGICTPHPDYRVVWDINSTLKWQLGKANDLFVTTGKKGNSISQHSYFLWNDTDNVTDYYFIKNKAENKFLIPEYHQIDYFILIQNLQLETTDEIVDKLKKVGNIMAVFSYDPLNIPSAENIIL